MKLTKKQKEIAKNIDLRKEYKISEAISYVKKYATAKFDESVDIAAHTRKTKK